jgi:short-subunit dehydrogenase
MGESFVNKYGPWAVVAGASEGLGAEYGRQLAARGLSVLLIARRAAALDELAAEIRGQNAVQVRTAAIDLADPDLANKLRAATDGLEVGLVVYNAAYSTIGEFLTQDLDSALKTIDVNCRGPVIFAHLYGRAMATRRRGGIILMSSFAGGQGSPLIATYAATKAFNLVFGEGLWDELGRAGVDVLVCRAGATRTPNYARSQARGGDFLLTDPPPVVQKTLDSLGRRPTMIPGLLNGFSAFLMGRLLPRKLAVQIMSKTTRSMYER